MTSEQVYNVSQSTCSLPAGSSWTNAICIDYDSDPAHSGQRNSQSADKLAALWIEQNYSVITVYDTSTLSYPTIVVVNWVKLRRFLR